MPDTPPHQNVRRYSHQTVQGPQQPSMQVQQTQNSNSSQYSYTGSTHITASPSSRHSITSEFSGINIRDDTQPAVEKSARPNLSVHPGGLRPAQQKHQDPVPSSPTRQSAVYNSGNYAVNPMHPVLVRTASDEMRLYTQPSSNSRHSSPMHTVSPTTSPYFSTTPHTLNSISEQEQIVSWISPPTQTRQSPSRLPYSFPPSRDTVSPRAHMQQSPSHNRHSMSHVPQVYDTKAQYSPRQAAHFPPNAMTSPAMSPTSYSPRHATFAMTRDAGSMMSDVVYSCPLPAKFRMTSNAMELSPIINSQPKYRRANPDGGFISVCLFAMIIYDSPYKP